MLTKAKSFVCKPRWKSNDKLHQRNCNFAGTVPVVPVFRCADRAEKRREYYKKLEEKRWVLAAEKQRSEAQKKEEEEKALKEFRKTLFIKANPVPTFYYEGPPPKLQLKKIPPTRAKSPKLHRRSCSDASGQAVLGADGCCIRCFRLRVGNAKSGSK